MYREQIQSSRQSRAHSDRCIAHNYKKHGDEREQIKQTTDIAAADSGRHQIQADSSQTTDSDNRSRFRQTE
ncbi:hypothetical protein Tco_0149856 [Tanacetum coccineum]